MQVANGVTECPACGAPFRRAETIYLGLLNFFGWCFLLIGAQPYIQRAPDIGSFSSIPFPAVTVILGAACLALRAVLRRHMPYRRLGGERTTDGGTFPTYDSKFCRRALTTAVVIGGILLVATLVILLRSEPGSGRCPGWTAQQMQGWLITAVMLSLWIAGLGFVAIWWDRYDQRTLRTARKRDSIVGAANSGTIGRNQVFVIVGIGAVLFCAMPPLSMLSNCVNSSGDFSIHWGGPAHPPNQPAGR